jgi:ubiquinone/menaquinone biosynthesis C-methylase UbiE
MYWDSEFGEVLEAWGEDTVWKEILLLLACCHGRVLDIACGTGRTMELASRLPRIEVHGCDISDALIERAVKRGIDRARLAVCDATSTDYRAAWFDHAYSIGSLEHFTEEGIEQVIAECRRVTRGAAFHHMPVSESGRNEGWMKTIQSFFNNSAEWWVEKFRRQYGSVEVLPSTWRDPGRSIGCWFVCQDPGATVTTVVARAK